MKFLLLSVLLAGAVAQADPREAMREATALIEQGRNVFARSVLEPALIDPRLTAVERARAYYLRGYAFLAQGYSVSARKDFNRALEFHEDNAAALITLGDLHARGVGTARNRTLAFHMFARAAELGSHQGALFAGRAHLLGEGTAYDVAAARRLLAVAAEAGETEAMVLLGMSHREPYAEPPDAEVAKGWYEQAAAAGDARGAVAVGHMLKNGELGEPDLEQACERFQAAAEGGSAAAHASFAHCVLDDDADAARHHFERAAAGGHVNGFLGLGYLAEHGLGRKADLASAESWYRRAAGAGSGRGQFDAARLLLARGGQEEEKEALALLSEATQEGGAAAANAYAWVLATSQHDAHRDGKRAVQFAEYAVSQSRTASTLDTLAAAYAEAGRWDAAVEAQGHALEANGAEDADLARRLKRYQARQPWRE